MAHSLVAGRRKTASGVICVPCGMAGQAPQRSNWQPGPTIWLQLTAPERLDVSGSISAPWTACVLGFIPLLTSIDEAPSIFLKLIRHKSAKKGLCMFGFLFGGDKKNELIRSLLQARMTSAGFQDREFLDHIKKMTKDQLIGTPEGTIVTIVETMKNLQDKGVFLTEIIQRIENHRRFSGHNAKDFQQILAMARGESAGVACALYALYRINLEAPGRMSEDDVFHAFSRASEHFYA